MSVENGKNSSRRGVLSAQDGWRSWYSHEVLPSYMREGGNQALLSQEEEAAWAKCYQDSREKIRNLIQKHPQVILAKMRELNESPDRSDLANYIVLSHTDDDEINEDDDVDIDERLSTVESEFLIKIFDNSSEIIHKCIKGLSKGGKETDEGVRAVAEILGPYLRSRGKVHFQQRFYKECVELFISGKWHEEGVSEEEKKILCEEMRKANDQERQAMTALVEGNLRLVISVARRFSSGYMSLPDLVQEGNIGLMRAIENFDWLRGHRLSTYACYCIRQSISRALCSNGRAIRIPSNILRQLSKIHRCEQVFI
ncbi:MAG: sigma-70 family RNA polymerase sigma factor, partial [Lentisphaeria bacterium]|nr:sigma-70 family RNA polymerase sigma factor [Lentisphaeria bacterium]